METHGREMDAPATENGSTAPPAANEDVPDPEEDDLDDLDDMLGDFSASKPPVLDEASGKPELRSAEASKEPNASETTTDEFSRQLQDQMAALMGNVDESPEMKREIEAMMQELGVVMDPGTASTQSKAGPAARDQSSAAEEPFQKTIKKTMERMQASETQATAAAQSNDEDDMLAQMLNDMQNGKFEGTGDDEGFNKMLMGMMEQLTNKDILYEPMKELHDKFPAWMTKNRSSTKSKDLERYVEQQRLVGEIVERFEKKEYSDSKAEDREFIVERMQKMQAAGSPPADLVGDMNAASEALGSLDPGCAQQ